MLGVPGPTFDFGGVAVALQQVRHGVLGEAEAVVHPVAERRAALGCVVVEFAVDPVEQVPQIVRQRGTGRDDPLTLVGLQRVPRWRRRRFGFRGVEPDDLLKLLRVEADDLTIPRDQRRHDKIAGEGQQLGVGVGTLSDVAVVELDGVRVQEVPNTAALLSSRRPRIGVQAVENNSFHVSLHSYRPAQLTAGRPSLTPTTPGHNQHPLGIAMQNVCIRAHLSGAPLYSSTHGRRGESSHPGAPPPNRWSTTHCYTAPRPVSTTGVTAITGLHYPDGRPNASRHCENS